MTVMKTRLLIYALRLRSRLHRVLFTPLQTSRLFFVTESSLLFDFLLRFRCMLCKLSKVRSRNSCFVDGFSFFIVASDEPLSFFIFGSDFIFASLLQAFPARVLRGTLVLFDIGVIRQMLWFSRMWSQADTCRRRRCRALTIGGWFLCVPCAPTCPMARHVSQCVQYTCLLFRPFAI